MNHSNFSFIKINDHLKEGIILIQNGFPCGKWNSKGEGILHLRPFNVSELGFIQLNESKYVEIDRNIEQFLLKKDDVIFNNTNSEELVGKTAIWKKFDIAVLSNHMTIIRVLDRNRLSPQFLSLYFLFKWYEGFFRSVCRRHVNQASVSKERLREILIPDLKISEQKKIDYILSTVQRAIEEQERQIQVTTELKKALMHKLFTEGTGGEPQKETEIGLVPESWEIQKLGNLAEIQTGGTPSRKKTQY